MPRSMSPLMSSPAARHVHYKSEKQVLPIGAGRKPQHIFSTLFCEFVLFLFQSLSTAATTSRLFAALLTGLGSSQFFSQLSSTVLNDLCTSFQIFPPLFTSFQLFSRLLTSCQLFSTTLINLSPPLLNSSQLVSTLLTSAQLFQILFSSVELISSANLFNSPPLRSLFVTCSTCVCLISRQFFRNH